jgi:malonate-semialdehyde dehydrogenase (acetylating)/methylmalonate-semialdehyde dehydrogenase
VLVGEKGDRLGRVRSESLGQHDHSKRLHVVREQRIVRRDGGTAVAELGPTIIDGAPPESRAVREELFGPVLTLVHAPDLATGIQAANESRYGNAAVIFTSSGAAARQFKSSIEAGMVGVNIGVAAPVAWFPFAGWKDSFDGDLHANGRDAFEFYTRRKVVTSRW